MSLADLVEEAELTGRGGGGFSTATKLRAAAGAPLIVNACDGEPGQVKDGWVVEHHLAELVAGARLVSARVRFAAHRGSRAAWLLGQAGLAVLEVPDRYVSSEESALVALAHGGQARPMTKTQPIVLGGRDARGRRTAPTLVLNAETVWRIAQIQQHGAAWFRAHDPRLVTVTGRVPTPVVLETRAGVALTDLLAAAGAGAADLLVGGLGGRYRTAADASVGRWDGGLGLVEALAGCPADDVRRRLELAAGESAGQCGPCMFGVPALAAAWRDGREPRVRELAGLLPGRGACKLPDGVAGLVASALTTFPGHLGQHACDRSAVHVPA